MTNPLRIGVTGVGSLGMGLARDLQALDDTAVVAVCDVDGGNRGTAGKTLDVGPSHRYGDHERMLDGEDLDGVAIATPHVFHYEQTVAALERDVDVLCEKPLCIDLDNAVDLVRRAGSASAELMVGYQRHLDPAFTTIREQLDERVGDPEYVTAEVTQDWITTQRDTWRGDPDLSGGGQLYDTGSHVLDAVLWTTELTPTSVDAQMTFDDPAERVDKHAALTIRFANDGVASIGVSGNTPTVREHLHVWGDEGAAYVEGQGWDPRDLHFVEADGGEVHPYLDRGAAPGKAAAFAAVIRDEREPPATAADALRVTAVTEAAYESARSGERIDVDVEALLDR